MPCDQFWCVLSVKVVRFSHSKLLFRTIISMANPSTTTQEVVLRLDDETMQRLIVGIADHLRDATFSQSTSQQLPVTTSTVATTTNSGNPGSKILSLLHSACLSNCYDVRVHTRVIVGGHTIIIRSTTTLAVEVLVLSLYSCSPQSCRG